MKTINLNQDLPDKQNIEKKEIRIERRILLKKSLITGQDIKRNQLLSARLQRLSGITEIAGNQDGMKRTTGSIRVWQRKRSG